MVTPGIRRPGGLGHSHQKCAHQRPRFPPRPGGGRGGKGARTGTWPKGLLSLSSPLVFWWAHHKGLTDFPSGSATTRKALLESHWHVLIFKIY